MLYCLSFSWKIIWKVSFVSSFIWWLRVVISLSRRQRTAIVNGGIYLSNLIYYLVSLFISMNVDVA